MSAAQSQTSINLCTIKFLFYKLISEQWKLGFGEFNKLWQHCNNKKSIFTPIFNVLRMLFILFLETGGRGRGGVSMHD